MRILLAGMNHFPNQFSRALDKYGIEVVHISGDSSGHIPSDCAAVVIGTCQASHTKYGQVKDYYKRLGRPVFVSYQSFSPIKERFETFLKTEGFMERIVRRAAGGETVMSQAFKQAKEPKRAVHPHEIVNKIYTIVRECFEAGMDLTQTVEMLKAEGYKKASGEEYVNADVSFIRNSLGLKARSRKVLPTTPKPVKPPASGDIKLTLISKVLDSALPGDRKLDLLERINRGEITKEDATISRRVRLDGNQGEGLQLFTSNILSNNDKPVIVMSKLQAAIILESLSAIHGFVGS